jgi:ElaB/YqjD/DUF883 family membrane-anchored ribosome-binding protein
MRDGSTMSLRKDVKEAASEAAEELRPDLGQLKADFERLSESIGSLRSHLVGLGREGARSAQVAGLAQLDNMRREVDELAQQFRQQGRDTLGQVEQQVRDRPLTSLLMAFGIGMVLARLFGRGR